MTSASDLQDARERQDANVKRTVAVAALRKIHDQIDEWEAEDALARRRVMWFSVALLCVAAAAVLVGLLV